MRLLRRNRSRSLPALWLVQLNLGLTLSAAAIFLLVLATLRAQASHSLHLVTRSKHTIGDAVLLDCSAAHEVLTSIVEEVLAARILDSSRQVLTNWPNDQLIAQWTPDIMQTISGEVKVWLTDIDGRLLLLGVVGVSFLVLSALCCWLTQRKLASIISCLRDIANVTQAVRRDRNLGLRVAEIPIAELYELGSTFNGLLDVLEAWQDRLQRDIEFLKHKATHDSLTGLRNRAFFESQLSRALEDIVPPRKLALLFIDGNRLKEVNDRHGHAAGDAVLVAIAGRIRAQIRDGDLVARLGGDEFAVLAQIRCTEDGLKIAGKITKCMAEPMILPNDEPVAISLSVGIALSPDHASTPRGLLQAADEAMYEAKHRCEGGWRLAKGSSRDTSASNGKFIRDSPKDLIYSLYYN